MQPLTTIPFKIWVNNFSKHLPLPAYENNFAEFPLLYYLQYIFKLKIYTNETFAKEICKDFVGANVAPQLVKTKKVAGFSWMLTMLNLLCFDFLMAAFRSRIVTYIIYFWTRECQDLRLDFHVYIPLQKKSHRLWFSLFSIVSFLLMRRNWSFNPACM